MNPFIVIDMVRLLSSADVNFKETFKYSSTECVTKEYTLFANQISKLEKMKMKVQSFKKLQFNWDTYGAEPFSDNLILRTINVLNNLSVAADIYPTGRKSIQLEYEKANGDYLEFEIFEEKIEFLKIVNNTETEGEIEENQINTHVQSFYA